MPLPTSRVGTAGADRRCLRVDCRVGAVPAGREAVILLSVETLAVNDLRETLYRRVRKVAYPVKNGKLGTRCLTLQPVCGPVLPWGQRTVMLSMAHGTNILAEDTTWKSSLG